MATTTPTRRELLAVAGGAVLLLGAKRENGNGGDEVSATEDLMREHGVLRRVLLVYREILRRFDAKEDVPTDALAHAATIVRDFIEDYHERDEEEFLFPRFERARRLVDLVAVLRQQHAAGRRLTSDVLRLATAAGLAADGTRRQLADALGAFIRIYEPHAAREDTVLFPAFRALAGPRELHRLQELFEEREEALPHGGFKAMVDAVARLEQTFGIADLARFTPPEPPRR